MPPRIQGPSGLKSMTLCLRPSLLPALPPKPPLIQPLIHKATLTLRQRAKQKHYRPNTDPYREALRLERRNRNLARQTALAADRKIDHGDPVLGITTPYLESLDSAGQAPLSTVRRDGEGNPLEEAHALPTSPHLLNYRLTTAELEEAIQESYEYTKPDDAAVAAAAAARQLAPPGIPGLEAPPQSASPSDGALTPAAPSASPTTLTSPNSPTSLISSWDPAFSRIDNDPSDHAFKHRKAVEALRRITTLANGSSRDRRFANIRRIVDEFGRHNTDHTVRQKGLAWNQKERFEKIRGGPDTGSSEVQIAILTAKIRVLAKMYEGKKGNKDKANKRNLRLLCHRRQKLLKYMERKERGSGRWEHMINTLGLSPATWKGQIEIR